jgi:hypothetical protein
VRRNISEAELTPVEQIQINPLCIDRVPEFRKRLKALPSEIKVCPTHGEEVVIGPECNFLPAGYYGGVPPWEVYFEACCSEAIDNVASALR